MTEKEAKKELIRQSVAIDATVRVGKDGVDENLINEVTTQLKKRRLIKVKVLKSAGVDVKEIGDVLAEGADAHVIDVRGGVITLASKKIWNTMVQKKF